MTTSVEQRQKESRAGLGFKGMNDISDITIAGFAQPITLRVYRPAVPPAVSVSAAVPPVVLPIVLYFHGGGFVGGSLNDSDPIASTIARDTPAIVVSVGYSLAPRFPFPVAPEDAWLAAQWVATHAAERLNADASRMGVAGHDAGGNLATVLTMIARDRGGPLLLAQALLAPLLDPSMTRMADEQRIVKPDMGAQECANCYRAYLPNATERLHPYAAPLESRRLGGLPPALIASAEHDLLHVEAERYASVLIAAGIPTQVTRHSSVSHQALVTHKEALADVVAFFRKRLA